MSDFSARLAVLTAGLLATTLCAWTGDAMAAPGKLKSMSFNAQDATAQLNVTSSTGGAWDSVRAENIPFSADLSFDSSGRGYVYRAAVVLGDCNGNACKVFPALWKNHLIVRDWSHNNAPFTFNASKIPLGNGGGIPIMPDGQNILARCNDGLTNGKAATSHSFLYDMPATFIVETDKITNLKNVLIEDGDSGFPQAVHHWRSDTFKVKVVCQGAKTPQGLDVASPMADFRATGVQLFLTTFRSNRGGNAASQCRALRVTTRVQTTKAGIVDIKLWRKAGNGPVTSTDHSVSSSYDAAKNGYFADVVRGETFDATTYVQYMAEVQGDSFAPSTPWKDITVHCTGAGGGGLAGDMPNTGEDPLPPPKPDKPKPQVDIDADDLAVDPRPGDDKPLASWKGTVTLADSAGSGRKHCPRKGQAVFAVTRNQGGNFKYKLSCSNGQGFSGSVASYSQGGPLFEAYGAHDLNISRTRKIACTLQEVRPNGTRITLDKGAFDYVCRKPAIDVDADDLATAPQPTQTQPQTPPKPERSVVCKPGFKRVGKACERTPDIAADCKPGFKRLGRACVKTPAVSIRCAKGFRLVEKACVKLSTRAQQGALQRAEPKPQPRTQRLVTRKPVRAAVTR